MRTSSPTRDTAPHLVSLLAEQQRELEGIVTTRMPITPGSPYDGRTLGDTAMRTRTGVSAVAVVRQNVVHPSPRPDFVFAARDMVVMVGTADGIAQVARILEQG
ncbi:MAG: cation:proton antiporter regulatory subunit [Pseudonocardiaceae bacterium]